MADSPDTESVLPAAAAIGEVLLMGITEIRRPYYDPLVLRELRDILETVGQYVDIYEFSGGSFALISAEAVTEWTDICHEYDVKVSRVGTSKTSSSVTTTATRIVSVAYDAKTTTMSAITLLYRTGGLPMEPARTNNYTSAHGPTNAASQLPASAIDTLRGFEPEEDGRLTSFGAATSRVQNPLGSIFTARFVRRKMPPPGFELPKGSLALAFRLPARFARGDGDSVIFSRVR